MPEKIYINCTRQGTINLKDVNSNHKFGKEKTSSLVLYKLYVWKRFFMIKFFVTIFYINISMIVSKKIIKLAK